jgi:hypothetical protein
MTDQKIGQALLFQGGRGSFWLAGVCLFRLGRFHATVIPIKHRTGKAVVTSCENWVKRKEFGVI